MAASASRVRTGLAIAFPSAMVGLASIAVKLVAACQERRVETARSSPAGRRTAAAAASISPRRTISQNPMSQPSTLLPAPVGMIDVVGRAEAEVLPELVGERLRALQEKGCQLWLA